MTDTIDQVVAMQNQPQKEWENLFLGLIQSCSDRSKLEEIGTALNQEQFLFLLGNAVALSQEPTTILSPILVGLSPELFQQCLLTAPVAAMDTLRGESATEPLQHHLTLLGHEIHRQIDQLGDQYEELLGRIESIAIAESDPREIGKIIDTIHESSAWVDEYSLLIQNALPLVWITGRIDLIETYSRANESIQRLALEGFKNESEDTGLLSILSNRLESVYGDTRDPNCHDALDDDDPAFEALAKLGIWYLTDYLAIGLLPPTPDEELLEPGQNAHLFEKARENLKKKGLETVRDLKDNQIFSRKSLIEYLST